MDRRLPEYGRIVFVPVIIGHVMVAEWRLSPPLRRAVTVAAALNSSIDIRSDINACFPQEQIDER